MQKRIEARLTKLDTLARQLDLAACKLQGKGDREAAALAYEARDLQVAKAERCRWVLRARYGVYAD